MGQAKRLQEEGDTLKAKVTKRTGRYELATKVEVSAFVGERMKRLASAIQEEVDDLNEKSNERDSWAFDQSQAIIDMRARLAELELSNWQRCKRALSEAIDRVLAVVIPPLRPSRELAATARLVADSPYTEIINRAAAAFQAEHGQSVGDSLRAELIDLDDLDLEQQSIEIAAAIRAIEAYEEVPPIPIDELHPTLANPEE